MRHVYTKIHVKIQVSAIFNMREIFGEITYANLNSFV